MVRVLWWVIKVSVADVGVRVRCLESITRLHKAGDGPGTHLQKEVAYD